MEALRAIVDSQQLASIIDLPLGLRNREVEVIVLPSKPVQREEIPSKTACFTDEQREQFRQHREKCVAEHELQRQGKRRRTKEEFHELLLQCPVADGITNEQQEQFRRNGEKLIAATREKRKQKPKRSKEEFHELLLQCPVADEETIRMQDEVREEMRRWRLE